MIAPARFQWPDTTEPEWVEDVAEVSWRDFSPREKVQVACTTACMLGLSAVVLAWCFVLPVIGLLSCLGVL